MKIVLVLHDIRSLYNIGSLIRTADGFGVETIYSTGLTPFLLDDNDVRPPHVRARVLKELHKTALGAEVQLPPRHFDNIAILISTLRTQHYQIIALEQTEKSQFIAKFKPVKDVALILGSETVGLPAEVLSLIDKAIEIPMLGNKESFNVTIAASIALYELRREALY